MGNVVLCFWPVPINQVQIVVPVQLSLGPALSLLWSRIGFIWLGNLNTLWIFRFLIQNDWHTPSIPWFTLPQTDTTQSTENHLRPHSPCTLCLPATALWEALQDNCLQNNPVKKQFHPNCNKPSELGTLRIKHGLYVLCSVYFCIVTYFKNLSYPDRKSVV